MSQISRSGMSHKAQYLKVLRFVIHGQNDEHVPANTFPLVHEVNDDFVRQSPETKPRPLIRSSIHSIQRQFLEPGFEQLK